MIEAQRTILNEGSPLRNAIVHFPVAYFPLCAAHWTNKMKVDLGRYEEEGVRMGSWLGSYWLGKWRIMVGLSSMPCSWEKD